MYRHDGYGVFGNSLFNFLWINVGSIYVHVSQYWGQVIHQHGIHSSHEGHGRNNNFCAVLPTIFIFEGVERDLQSCRTRRTEDGVFSPVYLSESLFQLTGLITVSQARSEEHTSELQSPL